MCHCNLFGMFLSLEYSDIICSKFTFCPIQFYLCHLIPNKLFNYWRNRMWFTSIGEIDVHLQFISPFNLSPSTLRMQFTNCHSKCVLYVCLLGYNASLYRRSHVFLVFSIRKIWTSQDYGPFRLYRVSACVCVCESVNIAIFCTQMHVPNTYGNFEWMPCRKGWIYNENTIKRHTLKLNERLYACVCTWVRLVWLNNTPMTDTN